MYIIYTHEYKTCRETPPFLSDISGKHADLDQLRLPETMDAFMAITTRLSTFKTCPRNISSTDHVHVPKAIFHVFNAHALADVCGVQGFPVLLSPQMLIVASKVWQETTQERDLYVREWMVSNKSSIWIDLMVDFPEFAIHIRLV